MRIEKSDLEDTIKENDKAIRGFRRDLEIATTRENKTVRAKIRVDYEVEEKEEQIKKLKKQILDLEAPNKKKAADIDILHRSIRICTYSEWQ